MLHKLLLDVFVPFSCFSVVLSQKYGFKYQSNQKTLEKKVDENFADFSRNILHFLLLVSFTS